MKSFLSITFFCWMFFCIPFHQVNANTMDTVIYPFDIHYAQINEDIKIAYFDEGEGDQTLLMIHGLGSYAPAWKKVIDSLQQDYRCIALDLPGYGKTGKGNHLYSMEFFAKVIEDFVTHLALENVVLVGHSMGAQIAMTAMLTDPGLAEKLVLIAPAGFETFSEEHNAWFKGIMTPAAIAATTPERIRLNFAINFHQMAFPEDAEFMYEDRMILRADTSAYQAYCEMIPQCVMGMLEAPVFEQLPNLKTPIMVIYGKGDLLIPNKILHPSLSTEKVAQAGIEKLPNAQLEMIDDCGHFVQWECADQVNEIIKRFLK